MMNGIANSDSAKFKPTHTQSGCASGRKEQQLQQLQQLQRQQQ